MDRFKNLGSMEQNSQDIITMEKKMEMEHWLTKMVHITKDIGWKTKKVAMVSIFGIKIIIKVWNIKENGKII